MNQFFVRSCLVLVLLTGQVGLTPAISAEDPEKMTPERAADYYGLLLAAAEFCPGGIVTEKGKAFGARFEKGPDAAKFKELSAKIVEAWRIGTRCKEGEMDRPQLAMCRTMHLRNCRGAWTQMGPDGTNLPGLLDTDYKDKDKKD